VCDRFDTGRWSRYDLYPEPPQNVSSSFYHHLHISQFKALEVLYGAKEFGSIARRFEAYEAKRRLRAEAFARKVSYRIAIPRHRISRDPQVGAAEAATQRPSRQLLLKILRLHPIRRP